MYIYQIDRYVFILVYMHVRIYEYLLGRPPPDGSRRKMSLNPDYQIHLRERSVFVYIIVCSCFLILGNSEWRDSGSGVGSCIVYEEKGRFEIVFRIVWNEIWSIRKRRSCRLLRRRITSSKISRSIGIF